MRNLIICLYVIAQASASYGQAPTPPADLEGNALRSWLRSNWYQPWHDDLGYSNAREEMFGYIDNEGGDVYGVYSGFSQDASYQSFLDPINTEHTVPQSFFNSATPMRSDIHHLFPTHMDANSARGSLPFAEIVDSFADAWLTSNGNNYTNSGNVPSSNIDNYSEVRFNNFFEPREDHKGNVARAVFYFYTMYPSVGNISAVADIDDLYQWHLDDPVDTQEIQRNDRTQERQGNFNPYITLPSLVAPAWGFSVGIDEEHIADITFIQQGQELVVSGAQNGLQIDLISITGQTLLSTALAERIDIAGLSSGIYLLQVSNATGVITTERLAIQR